MALEPEKQQIGVQMPQRTLRTFRPAFPDIQLPGVQRLARTMESIGESEAQATAKETALDAARSVSITGQNGEPIRPPTPDEFGRYAKEIFDKAIDSRYNTAVTQDAQKKIFDIFNENSTDPQKAFELSKAHATGVISAAPLANRAELERDLGSQIQSQYRGFSLQQSRMDRYNNAVGLKEQAADLEKKATDAFQRGQIVEADRYFRESRSKLETLAQMRMLPSGRLESFDERRLSIRGATVLNQAINSRIQAGQIDQENLLTIAKIFDGTARDTDSVEGFNKAWVLRNVPSPDTREAMYKYYTKLHETYIKHNNSMQGEVAYQTWLANPTALPPGKTNQSREDALVRFAKEQYGDNWMTPQNLQDLHAITNGQIPINTIKTYLDNPEQGASKEILAAKAQIFNQLRNFTTKDGRPVSIVHDLSVRDVNFYKHYINGLQAGNTHEKSLEYASKLVTETDPNGRSIKEPVKFIIDRMPVEKKEWKTPKGVYDFIQGKMSSKDLWGMFPFTSPRIVIDKLPVGPKEFILQRMAAHMGMGSDPAQSAKQAIRDFDYNYVNIPWNRTADTASGSGWVRKELAIPEVIVPGKAPDRTWVKDFWNNIIRPEPDIDPLTETPVERTDLPKMFISNGQPLPKEAQLGKEIYFRANANGTHTIMYDSKRGVYPVVDENQVAMIVDLRQYANRLQENIRIATTLNAEQGRKVQDKLWEESKKPAPYLGTEAGIPVVISENVTQQFQNSLQRSRIYKESMPSITDDIFIKYNPMVPESVPTPIPRPSDQELNLAARPDVSLPQSRNGPPGPVSNEYPIQFKDWKDSFKYQDALNDASGYTPRYLKNARLHTGVHRSLQEIIDIASSAMPDNYSVEITSHGGKRSAKSGALKGSRHITGDAIDILIKKDGKILKNLQHGPTFRVYEQFAQLARTVQTELYPELTGQFRWGGYFKQGVPVDMMHFDVGRSETEMHYGTWSGGVKPQYIRELQKRYPGLVSVGMK